MRYAIARFNQHQRDLAYRIYVTDCLRITTENTAITAAALTGGKVDISEISERFIDFFDNKKTDNRTTDDIINGIKNKLK